MMKTLLHHRSDLTAQELSILSMEYESRKKSSGSLWVLWWFTGIFGGHRYFLGEYGWAIAHTFIFLFTFIAGVSIASGAESDVEVLFYAPMTVVLFLALPAFLALVDAFFISKRLSKKNAAIELKIIDEIKSMRPTTAPPAP